MPTEMIGDQRVDGWIKWAGTLDVEVLRNRLEGPGMEGSSMHSICVL
jgi:hypothetical protein